MEGVATATTMKVRQGGYISLKTGRMVGGTVFEVCAGCLGRGRTTIICQA